MKTACISGVAGALALSAAVTLFAQTPAPAGGAQAPPGAGRRLLRRRSTTCWRRAGTRRRSWRRPVTPAQGHRRARYQGRSGANFMKLPPNVYMGEGIGVATNSKGHIFVNTCAQQTRNFEFDQNGNYVREIGKDPYGLVFCHGIRVDAQDNIWVIDEGANIDHQVQPRRPRDHGPWPPDRVPLQRDGARREGAQSGAALYFQSPHRRRVRRGRQHLRRRRLRQFTHRQVRQERPFHQTSRQSRIGARPVQPAACHRRGCPGQCLCGQPQRPAHCGVRQRSELQDDVTTTSARPGPCASLPARHQYLYTSNSNPDNQDIQLHKVSGQIFKMELDGTVLGKFGVPGKEQGQFSTVHGIDCRVPNEILRQRNRRVALPEIHPAPHRRSRGQVMKYSRLVPTLLFAGALAVAAARSSLSRKKSRSSPPVIF